MAAHDRPDDGSVLSTPSSELDRLLILYRLKEEIRTGWQIRGISDPESVADHSWGTAFLCMMYAGQAGVDRDRAIAIALVHDIAESEIGDIATRVHEDDRTASVSKKMLMERCAMDRLFPVDATENAGSIGSVRALWEEYEAAQTEAARFVRDMNLVDMCLQALRYERERRYEPTAAYAKSGDHTRLDEFFATAEPRIATEVGRRLYIAVHAAYLGLDSSVNRGE